MFCISLIYLTVAINSNGFNNADEHFQIIEFAQFKLGYSNPSALAWEFHSQVRPGLQPFICFSIFKCLKCLGIDDPYTLSFTLRLLTAFTSLFAIRYFIDSNKDKVFKESANYYTLASYLLWFLPYINVRFSSETWSGITALLFLAVMNNRFYSKSTAKRIVLGFLLGLSILFRYQSGIMVAGALTWLVFVEKTSIKNLSVILLSLLAVLGIGMLLDRWLYGEFCSTLYNYFHVNIIEDVASRYGTLPWYGIIIFIIQSPGPFGILIISSLVYLTLKEPKNLIIWITLPFLFIHSLIPHKELRFLYPLANLSPVFVTLAYQKMQYNIRLNPLAVKSMKVLFVFFNLCGLWVVGTKGAGDSKIAVTRYVNRRNMGHPVNLIYIKGLNPYSDWPFPKNTFYRSEGIHMNEVETIWKPHLLLKKKGYINLLLISADEMTGPRTISLLHQLKAKRVFQTFGKLTYLIHRFYDPKLNDNLMIIYELE